jgi:hypothetical protein
VTHRHRGERLRVAQAQARGGALDVAITGGPDVEGEAGVGADAGQRDEQAADRGFGADGPLDHEVGVPAPGVEIRVALEDRRADLSGVLDPCVFEDLRLELRVGLAERGARAVRGDVVAHDSDHAGDRVAGGVLADENGAVRHAGPCQSPVRYSEISLMVLAAAGIKISATSWGMLAY